MKNEMKQAEMAKKKRITKKIMKGGLKLSDLFNLFSSKKSGLFVLNVYKQRGSLLSRQKDALDLIVYAAKTSRNGCKTAQKFMDLMLYNDLINTVSTEPDDEIANKILVAFSGWNKEYLERMYLATRH